MAPDVPLIKLLAECRWVRTMELQNVQISCIDGFLNHALGWINKYTDTLNVFLDNRGNSTGSLEVNESWTRFMEVQTNEVTTQLTSHRCVVLIRDTTEFNLDHLDLKLHRTVVTVVTAISRGMNLPLVQVLTDSERLERISIPDTLR